MRLLDRLMGQRSISYQDVWSLGGSVDYLGVQRDAVARSVALYATHRTIIDAVSATPLHAFRTKPDGSPERLLRTPDILRPPVGQPHAWKAQYCASVLSDGNAFGLVIGVDRSGWPTGVLWLNPYDVEVDESGPVPRYVYAGRPVDRESIIHIPWIVPPGKFRGISPIKAFKTTIETGVYAQQSASDWFKNGAIPAGHLKNDKRSLDKESAQAAKAVFKAAVSGRDVLVTGNDWSYETIGVPADEARFIETLKLSATQIASIYGVPPEEVGGDRGNSLTYSTLEQDDLRFNARVVRPWAVRLEEALTAAMPRPQYAKFNLDANVRADLKTRMEAHEIAQRAGVATNDEVRRLEDRAPLTPAERDEWLTAWHNKQPDTPTDSSGSTPNEAA